MNNINSYKYFIRVNESFYGPLDLSSILWDSYSMRVLLKSFLREGSVWNFSNLRE